MDQGLLVKYQAYSGRFIRSTTSGPCVPGSRELTKRDVCFHMPQCASRFKFFGDYVGKILDTLAYVLHSE
jgi:hypothetical protein